MNFGKAKTQIDEKVTSLAMKEVKELKTLQEKTIKAEVKGSTYDHLFIKVTDMEGKILGGAGSWRQFEELIENLRVEVLKEGFKTLKVEMTFAA